MRLIDRVGLFSTCLSAVVGCEDIRPPSRDARVTRHGDVTTVVCAADQSGRTWQVTCRDNAWTGHVGNCSSAAPSSLAGNAKAEAVSSRSSFRCLVASRSNHEKTRELPGEIRDNARNNARCTQARKTTQGMED